MQGFSKVADVFVTPSVSYALTISSFRVLPRFILVLTLIINDFAFYKWHRKFEPEYPHSVLSFTDNIDVLKELGITSFTNVFSFLKTDRTIMKASNQNLVK